MLGHHRPVSETPFQWRFAVGPTMRYLYPLSPNQPKKALSNLDPPLTKLSGSAHDVLDAFGITMITRGNA